MPFACRVSYDLRLFPGETKDSVVAQFRELIAELGAADLDLQAEVQIAQGELVT